MDDLGLRFDLYMSEIDFNFFIKKKGRRLFFFFLFKSFLY
jgi:hypothetical protein